MKAAFREQRERDARADWMIGDRGIDRLQLGMREKAQEPCTVPRKREQHGAREDFDRGLVFLFLRAEPVQREHQQRAGAVDHEADEQQRREQQEDEHELKDQNRGQAG